MNTTITIQSIQPEHASALGDICYDAFSTVNARHNFPCDFESREKAIGFLEFMASMPSIYSSVAVVNGDVSGSAFLWEGDPIFGVGPVTVNPSIQGGSIGKAMMKDILARAKSQNAMGVRLVQAAFNMQSLALYTKLGFRVLESLAVIQGEIPKHELGDRTIRIGTESDIAAANKICEYVHGHHRQGEIFGAIAQNLFRVVETDGYLTGYTTSIGFFGHTVGLKNEDVMALISTTESVSGPGLLLPMRNYELFKWCLDQGMRLNYVATLMGIGYYQDPAGAYVASILY